MPRFKVGVQIHPQHCTTDQILDAACRADALGVETVWVWDHFFPLYGDPEGAHFECYTLLGAIARETKHAMLGAMVAGNTYRNPELLATMTHTLDHISGGRAILGVGAGWNQRDHDEYGFEFGDAAWRLREFGKALPRMKSRLAKSHPAPIGPVPIMIGGGGEKVTLRLVARHADMWNGFPPARSWAHKNQVLDQWCAREGRDGSQIERTANITIPQLEEAEPLVDAGVQHLILEWPVPFEIDHVQWLLRLSGR